MQILQTLSEVKTEDQAHHCVQGLLMSLEEGLSKTNQEINWDDPLVKLTSMVSNSIEQNESYMSIVERLHKYFENLFKPGDL